MKNLKILMSALTLAAVTAITQGCAHTDQISHSTPKDKETGEAVKLTDFLDRKTLANAAYVVVIGKNGDKTFITSDNSPIETCTDKRGDKVLKQCRAFRRKLLLTNVQNFVTLSQKGSPRSELIQIGPNKYKEICWDDESGDRLNCNEI